MSFYTYITTIQPPTAVHDAVKGSFLSSNETNLIISKGTRIEIYTVEKNTLIPTLDFDVYCHIAKLHIIHSKDQQLCSLFILSEQRSFYVIRYNPLTKTIITEHCGFLGKQLTGRETDYIFVVKDPENQLLAVSTFSGTLCIIPIQGRKAPTNKKGKGRDIGYNGQAYDPFNIKTQEFNVKSMVALNSSSAPTIAILNEDLDGMQIKFYQINLSTQHMDEKYKVRTPINASTHCLIPMPQPFGGVIAIAEQSISYFDAHGTNIVIDTDFLNIVSHEVLSGSSLQFLLGDSTGTIYLLSIKCANTKVTDLYVKKLCEAPICSTMVYLDFHMLYLGSAHGDSLLMKIHEKNGKLRLKKVDEYSNLGPITDFCIFDLDKQGKQTLVCCSGANNDGSLRIVQNGIGFIERANISITGVQNIWTLSSSASSSTYNDNFQQKNDNDIIVLSTLEDTRILYHPNKDSHCMKELETYSMFDLSQPTLIVHYFEKDSCVLQVTKDMIRLMKSDFANNQLITWTPSSSPSVNNILIAVAKGHWCIVSCEFGKLSVIKVDTKNNRLLEIKNSTLHNEISCMDIVHGNDGKPMLAIGLWGGNNIQLLSLPDLNVISQVKLQHSVPHSILYQVLHHQPYIFVSLGDGKVISYRLEDTMELQKSNEITLGTRSASLHSLAIHNETVVLAASDRPTIINSPHHHLAYSAVNLEEIKTMTTFNNARWKNSLILVTENALLIGDIDPVRKLHYSKIPLNKQMGRSIAYHEEFQTIILGTVQELKNEDTGIDKKTGWIHLYDAKTFKEIGVYDLLENETIECICISKIFNDDKLYIFMGTGITTKDPNKNEGRIIMYQMNTSRSLQLIDSVDVPGVVYCIKPYMNSIVAAVCGSIYHLNSFKKEAARGERMTMERKIGINIIAVDLDTRDDSILVGDFMQSMSLLKMEGNSNNMSTKLSRIANDYNANWMTSVKIVDKDVFIGAEMNYNVFTLQCPDLNDGDKMLDDTLRMDIVGEYHIGHMINRLKEGSLVNEINTLNKYQSKWSLLYATVNGSIGSMVGITEEDYHLLLSVQGKILELLPPIADMDYNLWRLFDNGTRTGEARNFIDGNLVEKYLGLTSKQQQDIAHSLSYSVEQLQIKIESLSQL